MLGSLYCDNPNVLALITAATNQSGKYRFADLLPENIADLFVKWNSLFDANNSNSVNGIVATQTYKLRSITANNNWWNNGIIENDIEVDYSHPMFTVNNDRAYNWHIAPQTDDSTGSLTMDSPRIKEIHAALNAAKWSTNPDDANEPRQDDLGWRIERMNEVLGIRVGTDLTFDPVKEKAMVRRVVNSSQKLDPKKVGVNNFGSDGMVVKRINNRFKGKEEIVSDQCVIVQDLLQLIQEYQEQHNLAVGIQESSAIEIKEGKNRARFDNQLGLLVELFNLLTSANEMTRATLISSLVSQSQTNEIIAGLGLPSVTKTIPVSIDKKVTQLPYKGIAPHRSISQEVATCTANVGIVLGQLL